MRAGVPLGLVALAFGVAGAAASGDDWKRLHRPLLAPQLAARAHCPVSAIDTRFDFGRYGVGDGIGRGPAYPIVSPAGLAFVTGPGTEFAGSAWGGQKTLWFVSPRYRGPVLIRGRRVGARGFPRFDRGRLPAAELRIPSGASPSGNPGVSDRGQRYRPSYTRLREPGCYAFQVDGLTFSYPVVFRAELSN
jgi:hypothetical protein